MLKIEELLKYGINGMVTVKDYEYISPEEIVVRTNGQPTQIISSYTDEKGRPTMVIYKDYNVGMMSKAQAKTTVTRKKVYNYYGPCECISECKDYRNGELCSIEINDRINIDKLVSTFEDLKDESIMTSIIDNINSTEIVKIRSEEENRNRFFKRFLDGSSYLVNVYKYRFGEQILFQYIKVFYDIDDKPIKTVQKLYDSKFNRVGFVVASTEEELEAIPWLEYNNEVLVKETGIGADDLIRGRVFQNKTTKNFHVIYDVAGPAVICEEIIAENEDILDMTVDMGDYEYHICPYNMPGSGLYTVTFYKSNDKNNIEQSVIMMVKSENIKELVGKIFEELCSDAVEYFAE